MKKRFFCGAFLLLVLLPFVFVQSCSDTPSSHTFKLSIIHLNDTHSHLEADPNGETMKFDEVNTKVFLGGFTRIKTAIDKIRSSEANTILLLAGDAVQGTLYFTKFNGMADIDFSNLFGVDAMTLGNHEFDRGPQLVKNLIDRAAFPILSANIDFSREPLLAGRVKPYTIKQYGSERVAIIGLTTEETPLTSLPGPNIIFKDVKESLQRNMYHVASEGINKVIVLSHIGYEMDKKIASEVTGIDVIVGGHSHSLLGNDELKAFGLSPEGSYPTEVTAPDGKKTLVVQAWRWGEMIGHINVVFDEAGDVISYEAKPVLLLNERFIQGGKDVLPESDIYKRIISIIDTKPWMKIYQEDAEAIKMLAPLKAQVDEMRKSTIATTLDDLIRGLNSGPGPLVIDSFLIKTNSDIGLINCFQGIQGLHGGYRTVRCRCVYRIPCQYKDSQQPYRRKDKDRNAHHSINKASIYLFCS
ncbi:MAG: metallophosphoesterase [Thermodesulfovibrionales bacterium]|nr:metallophosphoesterase [Thermodesulfovibrionales bacterium]